MGGIARAGLLRRLRSVRDQVVGLPIVVLIPLINLAVGTDHRGAQRMRNLPVSAQVIVEAEEVRDREEILFRYHGELPAIERIAARCPIESLGIFAKYVRSVVLGIKTDHQ